ncbi:fungal hydrophobin-domain-containing protein [Cyathus striatus]|nr:fungal hydrophobin-domain-containing protein [Cyathus striatus]KAF8986966.1 fungal hydrophobin-domain-containing protein [Cyathus striatus]
MQFKLSAVTLALATLAAATPTRRNDTPASQCTTGNLQCCQTTGTSTSQAIAPLLSLLGVVVQDVTALIGATCSPISVIGVGGNSCTAQPVCCTDNSFNGVIALGCSPVNLNL